MPVPDQGDSVQRYAERALGYPALDSIPARNRSRAESIRMTWPRDQLTTIWRFAMSACDSVETEEDERVWRAIADRARAALDRAAPDETRRGVEDTNG